MEQKSILDNSFASLSSFFINIKQGPSEYEYLLTFISPHDVKFPLS